MNLEIFADRLREHRKAMQLTQAEMASRLNLMPQTVSKWERGLSAPDIDNLIELATMLGVTVDELIRPCDERLRTFVAIDGGGTKTEFVLFTEGGHILSRVLRGSTNPNVTGAEETKKNIESGLKELLIGIRPAGVFAGVAGSMTPGNSEIICEAIKTCIGQMPVYVNSDIINVIYSVPGIDKCIAAICGTGSSVFAWDGKNLTRYGGWGYLFDNAGSGYDIGCDILRECFALNDGFGQRSKVTDLAEKMLGGRAIDKLDEFYHGGRDIVARFAPCAFEAYRQGDAVAERIIERNMNRLVELINAANKCSFEEENADIVISGGLIKDADIIEEFLKKKLGNNQKLIFPDLPQIYGAAAATMKFCNKDAVASEEFYKNFETDYNALRKDKR